MYPYINIGERTIGAYGVMLVLAVLTAGFLSFRRAKKYSVPFEDVLIVGAAALAFAFFCGKLLYIFVTYPLSYLWKQLSTGNFAVFTDGGLVFYGALIGGIVGALIGIRIAGCGFQKMEQTVVPLLPLGHGIGRIGCFLAGCCYGLPYEGVFAVYYPHSVAGLSPTQGCFPIQLMEAGWNVLCFILLVRMIGQFRKAGYGLTLYLLLYAIGRFFLEYLRGDAVRGIWFGLSVSQWISLFLIVVSGAFFLFCRYRIAEIPGEETTGV